VYHITLHSFPTRRSSDLVVNSSNTISINNNIIFNNTASGTFAPVATVNSILTGSTSGYISAPGTSRKLRWIDPSTVAGNTGNWKDRKSTRLNSSHVKISY